MQQLPGPLQVRGCMGAIGGAASNLRQWPHFLIRLRRSRPYLATRIAPASERRTGVGLGVPPRDGNRPLLHCGAFEAPQTERWSPWQARYWSCDTGGRS